MEKAYVSPSLSAIQEAMGEVGDSALSGTIVENEVPLSTVVCGQQDDRMFNSR